MVTRMLTRPLTAALLVVSVLGLTLTTVVGSPPQEEEKERRGTFGEVVAVRGDTLQVQTTEGIKSVQVTSDTKYQTGGGEQAGSDAIKTGDRVAVMVTSEAGVQKADVVMVIPEEGSTTHISGVVTEEADGTTSITTEDGQKVPVELGLNRSIPEAGTVATVAGQVNPDTGTLEVQSVQRSDEVVSRLDQHLADVQQATPDEGAGTGEADVIAKLQEKVNERRLHILDQAEQHVPAETRAAVRQNTHPARSGTKADSGWWGDDRQLGIIHRQKGHAH